MKKILFMLCLLVGSLVSYAQSGHIEFKGIPVDGKLSDFVAQMKINGFTFNEYARDYLAIMEGSFAGKFATIYLVASPKSKTMWKVMVEYGKKDSWSSLKMDYFEMKEFFVKKYGKPSDDYSFFSKPYYEGDGYELQALENEKCSYISFFHIPNGTAVVEIAKYGRIQIGYEDTYNTDIKNKENESSVLEDI